jgi:hypothetical protein
MKRRILAGLSVLAVAGAVGWKLASHPATPAALEDIRLSRQSEHSQPGPNALAGIRIRLSPADVGAQVRATDHAVPQVSLASE